MYILRAQVVGRPPNSDKGGGMKVYLENDPRKQHPDTLGGQNRKEREPGGFISCGAALGTILLDRLRNWMDCMCSAQSSLGTRSYVSVHILLLLVEAASGLVTGWHL